MEALRRCGMENFLTLETYKEWWTNERKYKLGFVAKSINGLIPDRASDDDISALIKAAGEFANNIPRPLLKGRTPNEAILEKADDNKRKWELDIYSKDEYLKDLKLASEYMAKGDFKASYKIFEGHWCSLRV